MCSSIFRPFIPSDFLLIYYIDTQAFSFLFLSSSSFPSFSSSFFLSISSMGTFSLISQYPILFYFIIPLFFPLLFLLSPSFLFYFPSSFSSFPLVPALFNSFIIYLIFYSSLFFLICGGEVQERYRRAHPPSPAAFDLTASVRVLIRDFLAPPGATRYPPSLPVGSPDSRTLSKVHHERHRTQHCTTAPERIAEGRVTRNSERLLPPCR